MNFPEARMNHADSSLRLETDPEGWHIRVNFVTQASKSKQISPERGSDCIIVAEISVLDASHTKIPGVKIRVPMYITTFGKKL